MQEFLLIKNGVLSYETMKKMDIFLTSANSVAICGQPESFSPTLTIELLFTCWEHSVVTKMKNRENTERNKPAMIIVRTESLQLKVLKKSFLK